MSKKNNETNWMSLSDMMTGLMVVFLFIAVVSIAEVRRAATDYTAMRTQIYEDLQETFGDNADVWGIEIDKDLTISFTNPDLLFGFDSDTLKSRYKSILDEFIPDYLEIITKPDYAKAIAEVRIEGYTSQELKTSVGNFMYNISLSQRRSNAVLDFILEHNSFAALSEEDQTRIKFWISANGLGYNRNLDSNGNLTFESGLPQDKERSRRVEFRILTNSDALLGELDN